MSKKTLWGKAQSVMNQLGIWLFLILLFIILSLTTGNTFLTASNLTNLIRQVCVTGVCAIGATVVICGGEMDLGAGSLAALVGCFSSMLAAQYGWNTGMTIAVSVLGGAAIGAFSGLIVTFLRVPTFIATLGMMYVYDGVTLLLTKGTPVRGLPESYKFIGRGYIGNIPIIIIILLAFACVFAFIFKYTKFGRNIVVVGENANSARLSGINVTATKIGTFACAGGLSALAGIMLMARLGSGQPTAASDLTLTAMAAVFVGGTSAVNTQGAVMKTLSGTLLIGMINNGLNLLEVNAYWQKVVLGIIIVGAIALDSYRTSKMFKTR